MRRAEQIKCDKVADMYGVASQNKRESANNFVFFKNLQNEADNREASYYTIPGRSVRFKERKKSEEYGKLATEAFDEEKKFKNIMNDLENDLNSCVHKNLVIRKPW